MAKVVGVFAEEAQAHYIIQQLVDSNLAKVKLVKLGGRFEEAIMQEAFFIDRDRNYAVLGGLIGGLLLMALFLLQSSMIISLPMLTPLSAGGPFVTAWLGFVSGASLGSLLGGLISLILITKINYDGHYMVSAICQPCDRKKVKSIMAGGAAHIY